jgi:hypothetical protein
MKNLNFYAVLILSALLLSCQKDEFKPVKESGRLHIDIGLSIRVSEVDSRLKAAPGTGSFKVTLYHSDGTVAMAFDSAAAIPDTLQLDIGSYYVAAHSDNNLPAAFENPYYYGESGVFNVSSNSVQTVLVSCVLANTIVTVAYSDNLVNSFEDYSTTVSTGQDSLVYTREETRKGYFQPVPLDIRVDLVFRNPDGTRGSKTLSGSIPDPMPNRHYEIFADASVDAGSAGFRILLDSSEVLLEVIQLTDDPGMPPAGMLAYGDLLITEIMYDPSALTDTEGEWFEIYNNSGREINLQNLVLRRDDANIHTISDPIVLPPGEFYVMARSATATDAVNTYLYASDILLPNTGAVLELYNEETPEGPGELIFSLGYGAAGFPDGTGTSISLDPGSFNAADAVNGASWCLSTSIFSTGDAGTPGASNDPCQ